MLIDAGTKMHESRENLDGNLLGKKKKLLDSWTCVHIVRLTPEKHE